MKKQNRWVAYVLAPLFCLSFLAQSVTAMDIPVRHAEIIFVLDASGSMQTNDPDRLAGDSVKQMAYSLPSNYRTGFVAYNTGVPVFVEPAGSAQWRQMEQSVDSVSYNGYTDTGAGLEAALKLFSEDAADKAVVLLSDGEIIMGSASATLEANARFENAVKQAAQDKIPIYTIALGDELDETGHNVFSASESTDGLAYRCSTPDKLQETVRTILFDVLGIQKSSVGVLESAKGSSALKVAIPAGGSSRVRILVTADKRLQNVRASFNAAGANVINGSRFAVVEIARPERQDVEIAFETQESTQVRAELMTEYEGVLEYTVTYDEPSAVPEGQPIPETAAHIHMTLRDSDGKSLLNDPYYDGKTVQFSDGTQNHAAVIQDGYLSFGYKVGSPETLNLTATLSELNTNVPVSLSAAVALNPPAVPVLAEPEPNNLPLWITLACLAAALLIIWLSALIQKKKRDAVLREAQPPAFTTKNEFTGRINLYVTRSPDDADVAPRTFNLFRQFTLKELSLQSILDECTITQKFTGAENILFRPGQDKALIITNNSDCTVLKNRELLIQGHSYPLFFNEKLNITFEDSAGEMEVHYKNLAPTEVR